MFDRKKELKKWFIDHPEVTSAVLAGAYGKSISTVNGLLLHHPSAPADFIEVCKGKGIPADLLPPATMTKADLLDKLHRLRDENAQLKEQLSAS